MPLYEVIRGVCSADERIIKPGDQITLTHEQAAGWEKGRLKLIAPDAAQKPVEEKPTIEEAEVTETVPVTHVARREREREPVKTAKKGR